MKFRFTYILAGLFLLFALTNNERHAEPDCQGGKSTDFYNLSCFFTLAKEETDEEEIQRLMKQSAPERPVLYEKTYRIDRTVIYRHYPSAEGPSAGFLKQEGVFTIAPTGDGKRLSKPGRTKNQNALSRRAGVDRLGFKSSAPAPDADLIFLKAQPPTYARTRQPVKTVQGTTVFCADCPPGDVPISKTEINF